ncbi:MAG: amidohydrolase [Bryobacteraceae bacterium]|nr:amidohydrolase [Bryobacteraceae bacterium]
MYTPWGDLPVADAHVHFFSHHFFALLAQQKQCDLDSVYGILGWERPAEDPVAFAGRWIAEMDRQGVAQAMLIASLPGDAGSVTAAVAAYPERFRSAAMVNPLAAAPVAGELDMLCLFPAMHGYALSDPAVRALIRPGQAVFVHCGHLSVGVRGKLGLPSPFNHALGDPLAVIPLAQEFPRTRFVIPHFGAGRWPDALTAVRQCPNVYLDTSSSNSWILPPLDLITVFRETLAVTGPERLLFGSDSSFFPRGWNRPVAEAQIEALAALSIDAGIARRLFVDNFYDFCGI